MALFPLAIHSSSSERLNFHNFPTRCAGRSGLFFIHVRNVTVFIPMYSAASSMLIYLSSEDCVIYTAFLSAFRHDKLRIIYTVGTVMSTVLLYLVIFPYILCVMLYFHYINEGL